MLEELATFHLALHGCVTDVRVTLTEGYRGGNPVSCKLVLSGDQTSAEGNKETSLASLCSAPLVQLGI